VEREPDIDAIEEGQSAAVPVVDVRELLAVFGGGVLGALARGGLENALAPSPGAWPWPTFAVNLAAAALLGYAVAWLGEHHPSTMYVRAFVATGVCGALSTFSAFALELIHLYEHNGLGLASGYAAASIAGATAALLIGMAVAPRIPAHVLARRGVRR
jgi:fluoride exporter